MKIDTFDYKVVVFDAIPSLELKIELDEYGAEGWELVSFTILNQSLGTNRAIFKRRIPYYDKKGIN